MSTSRVVILLLGLVSLQAADSSVLGPEECFSPLVQWCGTHACLDYEESVAALERLGPSAICYTAERGTCGDLRFTTQSNPTSGITHYFGTDGKVVGVTTFSDAHRPPPCDGGWRHYAGGPIRCSLVAEHNYCRNPQSSLDPRGEIRGRIVDAATGRPLQGAVVVASWHTELSPSPWKILFGLVVGGHGGTERRIARVQEVFSGDDGRFLLRAWSEAEQLRRGGVLGGAPALFAFFPGYEPVSWRESEPEVFGAMTTPRNKVLRMRARGADGLEKVRALSNWLDMNIQDADDSDAPVDSRFRVAVRAAQQRASTMVRQELTHSSAKPPSERRKILP